MDRASYLKTRCDSLASAMSGNTIAFISTYEHPTRDSIERTVREAFPEYRFQHIALKDVVKQHRRWLLPNLCYVAAEYGGRIIKREASLRNSYFRTSFLFRHIRSAMPAIIKPGRHIFSFQTQSLYDTSVPGVPHFIYTDHTHLSNLGSAYADPRKLRPPSWPSLEPTIYQNAALVFTRSQNVTRDLLTRYGLAPEKVHCVYAGANTTMRGESRPTNDGYANRRILFVGGDWERKGGPELVAAFQEVLRVFPDAHLTIAGARPALSLPALNCTVLGPVPITELSAHFAQASVFCLPTRQEPFGTVVVEAMLHRLPVVGTAIGALPEMVIDGVTGRLVAPDEPKELAAALIELLGDPQRCRQLGEAGYQLTQERYNWPAVGARMRAAIRRLIVNPSIPPVDRDTSSGQSRMEIDAI